MKNPYKLYLEKYTTHYFILNNIGENNVILDIGCNDGYLSKYASKSNKFYGLDYLEESVKKAKKVFEDAAVYDLNTLTPLPWKKKFDVLIFADVLEHVLMPEKVLQYFTDTYLKSGGVVIISLPNVANWKIRLNLLFGIFDYTEIGILDKTHLHLYTYKSAKKLIRSSQFQIVSENGTSRRLGPIMHYLPFLKPLFAINILLICKKT